MVLFIKVKELVIALKCLVSEMLEVKKSREDMFQNKNMASLQIIAIDVCKYDLYAKT